MSRVYRVMIGALILGLSVGMANGADNADLAPADVFGKWLTPERSVINIQPCGESDGKSVCGMLEWFADLEEAEAPILDHNNQDEALRARELKGIEIIYGFKQTKKGWRKGRIYDPGSGKTYKSKLTRIDAHSLKVEGCVGPVCQKFIWTRAPEAPPQVPEQ